MDFKTNLKTEFDFRKLTDDVANKLNALHVQIAEIEAKPIGALFRRIMNTDRDVIDSAMEDAINTFQGEWKFVETVVRFISLLEDEIIQVFYKDKIAIQNNLTTRNSTIPKPDTLPIIINYGYQKADKPATVQDIFDLLDAWQKDEKQAISPLSDEGEIVKYYE